MKSIITQATNDTQATASSFLPQAYLKGRFLPFAQAQISIATHALHYGTAVLGGIRGLPASNNPNRILLFRLDAHCQGFSGLFDFLSD
ncbi:hypothetical protein H6G76_29780 [Nostoc sp. FACHB-152]|uniref:hypothetical protein n=1 Tax=unclassified Nostoc TaxID=2593658 RepID=UPI00168504CF|nr:MULTISPECIES: hypothetical protein [unclassified Nostoc]MBD2451247.1 hypothetical protein [Nostoc sp. FACHB-152]MBD2473257.1 hypothetical protein [Nostoc sp. FACHB-145]